MTNKYLNYFFLFIIIIFSCSESPDFQFAWLTDTHVGAGTGAEDLRLAVRDINSQENVAFTIISGDVSEMGSNEELELAKEILDSLNTPYYIIPGNHDTKWSESGCTKFPELWGDDRFNFQFKNIRFIGMHQGPIMRMGDGNFAPEDIRWLEEKLSKIKQNQPLIFVTHYPLNSSISNWYEVLDRLKRMNTLVVLLGHGHRNRVMNFEGVAGVMGRSTLRKRNKFGAYNLVRVTQDSIYFHEKKINEKKEKAWHRLPLSHKSVAGDSVKYPRPEFSMNKKYPQVKFKWVYKTYHTIASSPAVWEDYVVVGNSKGAVICLFVEDGSQIWKFKANGSVYSTPDIAEGKVVFGSTDQNIYCLNVADGNLLWKVKTKEPIVAAPKIYQGVVYVGASDGIFRAIDLESGSIIWEFDKVDGFVETKPLIYREKVIFGAWDGNLYALNQADGNLVWKWSKGKPGRLYSPAACLPVAAWNKVFIVAPDRYMTAIDAETGETIWRTNRYKVRESIGISSDRKTVFAKCMQDTVIAYVTWSKQPLLRWRTDAKFGYDIDPSMLVEKNGVLFFGTQKGFVYALDSKFGRIKWAYRVGVTLVNTPVPVDSNSVVLTDMDGKVMFLQEIDSLTTHATGENGFLINPDKESK